MRIKQLCCLHNLGVPAEEVGRDAAGMLVDNLSHGGCVDEFLQDQVIYSYLLALYL